MIDAIQAISPAFSTAEAQAVFQAPAVRPNMEVASSFEQILLNGVEATNAKLNAADRAIAEFAIDDSVPAHRVTFALEEARLSLELMLQVRNRMVEAYQQVMNMQV